MMSFSRSGTSLTTSLLVGALLLAAPQSFAAKKFKRALVIAGGSVTPAVGLGIVQALREQGRAPDVIITTCGSSLASMIMNSYGTPLKGLQYAKSEEFFNVLSTLKVQTPSAITMGKQFSFMKDHPNLIPSVFQSPLMSLPENIVGYLPNAKFDANKSGPKYIIQASKALFHHENVGAPINGPLYQQVYFTDSDTAKALNGVKSPVSRLFPESRVSREVKVITNVTSDQAARAGVADPFLLNPARIGNDYYFTGAIDLIPLELAQELAEEVISTYPQSLFEDYEDLVIKTNFGFKQTDRVLFALQYRRIRWIDVTDLNKVSLEPERKILTFYDRIPDNKSDFAQAMQGQFDFGYSRTKEAVLSKNNTAHLRTPINPKLFFGFTCENANVWKMPLNDHCTDDSQFDCHRGRGVACTPIR